MKNACARKLRESSCETCGSKKDRICMDMDMDMEWRWQLQHGDFGMKGIELGDVLSVRHPPWSPSNCSMLRLHIFPPHLLHLVLSARSI